MIPILFCSAKLNVDRALKDIFRKSQEEVEITHHECNTGAKLYRWATWGRMYNCLCKCEDIRVHLDTVPNLNMYNMMTCNQNVL